MVDTYDGLTVGDVLTEDEIQRKNPRIYENSLRWNKSTGKIENVTNATGGGGGGGVSVDMTETNKLLQKQLDVVTTTRTSGMKNITNPVNFNISNLSTNIKQITVAVLSGKCTYTCNSTTATIDAGFCIEFGNGVNPFDSNITVNGACTLLIGWEG